MPVATLISPAQLAVADVERAAAALAAAGLAPGAFRWLDEGVAADLPFAGDLVRGRGVLEGLVAGVDAIVQAEGERARRLLVADMDSTMITVECIDELADYAGIKPEVADVTERAMRGELDFAAALDARVALLEGLGEDVLARCHEERVRLMPGAVALVRTMRAKGARTVLVSGGFTAFAVKVAAAIGFDRAVANRLALAEGRLTGLVDRPIVDAATKVTTLEEERATLGLAADAVLAVGDGANDIPMIRAAGLGVAYHAKPATAAAADARVDHCDLTALLYAQGWSRGEWVDG